MVRFQLQLLERWPSYIRLAGRVKFASLEADLSVCVWGGGGLLVFSNLFTLGGVPT